MTTYFLVADAGTARLFRMAGRGGSSRLTEVETFVCPPARLATRELLSDRTGRVFPRSARARGSPSHARHGIDSESDPHVAERKRFARLVARRVDAARLEGDLDALIIISPPRFLGTLRDALSEPTRLIVKREVRRDWVRFTPHAILARTQGLRDER
jgi:protein required for attachment to host cells